MPIQTEEQLRAETLKDVAAKMLLAARTAPKARGNDNLKLAIATGDTLKQIADKMIEFGNRDGRAFFLRDSANVMKSEAVVLIATTIKTQRLNCALCGFDTCEAKEQHPKVPCVFNTNDLGIAIGSAVSVAADNRADNRVMFSIGFSVNEMRLMDADDLIIFGIPLSSSGKSPFFDRPAV